MARPLLRCSSINSYKQRKMRAIAVGLILLVSFINQVYAQNKSSKTDPSDTVVYMYASLESKSGIYFVTEYDSIKTKKENVKADLLKVKALNESTFLRLCSQESGKNIKDVKKGVETVKFFPNLNELLEHKKLGEVANKNSTLRMAQFIFRKPADKESLNKVIKN